MIRFLLRKSTQLRLDLGGTPNPNPHHVAYRRTTRSGTVSQVRQLGFDFSRPTTGAAAMLKAHVKATSYTTASGAVVNRKEYDDSRMAGTNHPHPSVIGTAKNLEGGKANEAYGFTHNGKRYIDTGKEGNSMHDNRPVREFKSSDGHRVWLDHEANVHADSRDEAERIRGEGRWKDIIAGEREDHGYSESAGEKPPKARSGILKSHVEAHERQRSRQPGPGI